MAGKEKPMIVIKKITVVAGGAHGGAWKVAFADFMTAMMAFFLVMWLLATASEPTKKNVSDYFSTPSVIEYNFSNFGVELTLEKLFLDLINEPLKTLQSFIQPMDRTPNIMGMGMKKVVMQFMAEQLGDIATNVDVGNDSASFEIPDEYLFEPGTAKPNGKFIMVLEKLKGVVAGIEDSTVDVASVVYFQSVSAPAKAKPVAAERLDLFKARMESEIDSRTVDVSGRAVARSRGPKESRASGGYMRIEVKQKEKMADGRRPRQLADDLFGKKEKQANVYDNFVKQVSASRDAKKKPSRRE